MELQGELYLLEREQFLWDSIHLGYRLAVRALKNSAFVLVPEPLTMKVRRTGYRSHPDLEL